MPQLTTKTRFNLCGIVCLLPVLFIAARLFYLQIIRHDELTIRATREVSATAQEVKIRGKFLDRNGQVLAESLPTYTCAIMKRDTRNPKETLAAIASVLDFPAAELRKKWNAGRNYIFVESNIPPQTYEKLKAAVQDRKLSGIVLTQEYTRFYPDGESIKDIIGAVGTDSAGASGLELAYDGVLSGKIEKTKTLKDRYGQLIENDTGKTGILPSNIYLTIDSKAQFHAETAIKAAVAKTQAANGIAIVQDPFTGDILACAAYPKRKGNPFQWTYEPGSTFKVVTLSAALETKTIMVNDSYECGKDGKWEFNPQVTIRDDEPLGTLTVPDILAHSSNICSAKIALKTGLKDFYSYVWSYGFGTKTVINYPGESKGSIRAAEKVKPLDLAVNGFGHGLAVTAVQLVGAYSALANGGLLIEPRLVDKITDSEGATKYSVKPRQIRRVISQGTASLMTGMMRRVVEEGTGGKAKITGYTVAGKTGTSKKLENGKYTSTKHVASFCGFVPASKPKFTILIVVNEPKTTAYGGEAAAPAFADIAMRLLSDNAIAMDAPEPKPVKQLSPKTANAQPQPEARKEI